MFKAWALVGARLYSVPLRVPRKFYVNSVLPPEDPESPAQTLGGLKVTRTLPFGREAFHIYEASSQAMPSDCPSFAAARPLPPPEGTSHHCTFCHGSFWPLSFFLSRPNHYRHVAGALLCRGPPCVAMLRGDRQA